jgi:hypothetical protein
MQESDEAAETGSDGLTIDFASGRVLGCLVEKAMTTPDQYPMSLNAVVVACNQVSNREPVVEYDEALVERTLRALADRGLAKMVHRPGDRVVKYRQAVDDVIGLSEPETALIAVLMLRGPQTPGELRQRTTRHVEFTTLAALEESLSDLQERTPPLVVRLDRRPGQKEYRYRQLLAAEQGPVGRVAAAPPAEASEWDPGVVGDVAPTESEIQQLRTRVEVVERRLDELLRELGIGDRDSNAQDAGDL